MNLIGLGGLMESRLKLIRNWESLAQSAKYNVSALAEDCGVSGRQLERFFAISLGKSPHQWLHELRMRRAIKLLRDGSHVKETAYLLGYKDASHLTHDFKKYFGVPPTQAVGAGLSGLALQTSRLDR